MTVNTNGPPVFDSDGIGPSVNPRRWIVHVAVWLLLCAAGAGTFAYAMTRKPDRAACERALAELVDGRFARAFAGLDVEGGAETPDECDGIPPREVDQILTRLLNKRFEPHPDST